MFLSNSQQSYGIIPGYHPATNRKFSLYQYSSKRSCYMAVTLASRVSKKKSPFLIYSHSLLTSTLTLRVVTRVEDDLLPPPRTS